MTLSTSNRFKLLSEDSITQEIYVGKSPRFAEILRGMRFLFSEIYQPDADDLQNQTALLLRFEMQKWLTSPLIPDIDLFQRCGLENGSIGYKWGLQVENTVKKLKELFAAYTADGSVINNQFVQRFADLHREYPEGKIKIWCRKKERSLFWDLLQQGIVLDDGIFINSLAEYRRIEAFDVLIGFGPFKTSGIANTPAALITSPSYKRLVRFIWEGLSDEEGFAADPVLSTYNYFDSFKTSFTNITDNTIATENVELNSTFDDDLGSLHKNVNLGKTLQKCVLVEFDDEYGVLMRPGTNLLVFNPKLSNKEAIGYRYAADIDSSYYLVHYDSNVDLGDVNIDASKAPLAAIWKNALVSFWSQYPAKCIQAVKSAGIDIQDIERALNSWSAMNGSVIRAPRSKKHFEALITKVLEPSLIPAIDVKGTRVSGWRRAWAEIESSRVEAIQHGTVEHAIVNEQLVIELNNSISILRQNLSSCDTYNHKLQPDCGLEGYVTIKPIVNLTSSIYAPAEKFGKIFKLPILEQYCVGRGALYDSNDPEIY